jgi:hypothetical protein
LVLEGGDTVKSPNIRNTSLGLVWTILGVAGIIFAAIGALRAWEMIPGAFPMSLAIYLPLAILSLCLLIAGIGSLAQKKWAVIMLVIVSPIVLAFGIFTTISSFFTLYPQHIWFRGIFIPVILALLSLFTLINFCYCSGTLFKL